MSAINMKSGATSPDDLIDFCRDLVKIPSFTGSEKAVAEMVTARFLQLDFDQVQTDQLGNVIAVRQSVQDGPTLLLDGHMDVVTVEDPGQWQHAPFGAELSQGRIWGRGSADTKSSLAAIIFAAASIKRSRFCGRIVVVASVCEETLTGAAITPVLHAYRPDVFITGEPTSLRLAAAQKGRFSIKLQSTGRSAHTSTPQAGENAVYKMMEAIHRLRTLPLAEDPLLGKGILELTEIHSEPYPNGSYVPHGCQARFIGRTLPGETRGDVLLKLRQVLNDLPGVSLDLAGLEQMCYTGFRLQMEDFLPGWRNPEPDLWKAKMLAALSQAGLETQVFGFPGGTNAAATSQLGISSFIYGPGSLQQAHTVDEWVQADELLAARRGFEAIISGCLCRT